MAHFWQLLSEKYADLSYREKWLIGFCGLVGVSLILFSTLLEPAMLLKQASDKQVILAQQSVQQLNRDINHAKIKLREDPNKAVNLEFKKLLKESQALSLQLSQIIDGLVSPSQMAQLLEKVLQDNTGVNLVSMESMPAEPINKGDSGKQVTGYYVHPIRLEITGNYFAILRYLEVLEALPVKYYWRSFRYSVEKYPGARMVIEVYTLGTRQEFIGG